MSIVYETASCDISLKLGNDVRLVRWTIKNTDGSDYSFANKTDINLYIYYYKGGELLATRPESSTAGVSVVGNIIKWNDLWENVSLAVGVYYYRIIYEDSNLTPNTTFVVVDGYLTIT